jgi:hypothetical protein
MEAEEEVCPMRTSRKALLAGSALAALTLAGCGSAAAPLAPKAPAPTATVIMTVPAPTKTITRTATPLPASTKVPVPAPSEPAPQPQFANAAAVVTQFYQDITDHNYAAAWALGGRNLSGGVGYNAWVAGYGTTEALTLYNQADWGSGQVHAYLRAFQTDGTIRYYTGTYTVQNGVIVAAHIVQD